MAAKVGLDKRARDLVDHEIYESINNPGKLLLLATWRAAEATGQWAPVATENLGTLRHRRVRVLRDYGMMDRDEAPQFYSEARTASPRDNVDTSITLESRLQERLVGELYRVGAQCGHFRD